ncbi:unnamed protein product [Leptosia nina]|uniref:Neuropeptide CCHamide-2 n=1 Tax=Leptosia nina TaxID=320188 RepID=A0AAV1J363_9NEOP
MAQNLLAFSVLAVLVISVGVSAKRGCSAFGHSCYGGHGKRSGDSLQPSSSELLGRRQLGQEETPPHPVYPHSGYGILPSGDDIIPIRDGGVFEREDSARDVMNMKLRNIVKHWMDSFRRLQQNEDGLYVETL